MEPVAVALIAAVVLVAAVLARPAPGTANGSDDDPGSSLNGCAIAALVGIGTLVTAAALVVFLKLMSPPGAHHQTSPPATSQPGRSPRSPVQG